MLKNLLLSILFIAVSTQLVLAQTGSITGTVTNENGEPVPTANVFLVEIGRGIATNLDGEYTIENVEAGTYTLRVTFVGYKTYTTRVTIEAGQTITQNLVLKKMAVGLKELVVTGYGRKVGAKSVTSSIASISTKEIENVPMTSPSEILQGRAAGVTTTSISGVPGAGFAVEIRGSGSINAGSRPLYIVNGVQLSFSNDDAYVHSSPLAYLDPDNIASMQVLKDAAATAIYGAAGANGVVLITTKQGFDGPTQVTASISGGVTTAASEMDLMNTRQWVEYYKQAYGNVKGLDPNGAAVKEFVFKELIAPRSLYEYSPGISVNDLRYTNWLDYVHRRGYNQKYQLSFSGGNNQTRFYISGSYNNTKGQYITSYFHRYALNTSLDHDVSDAFQLGMDLALASYEQSAMPEDNFWSDAAISLATVALPFNYPYNDEGKYLSVVLTPAEAAYEKWNDSDVFTLVGNLSAQYDFTQNIDLRLQAGMDYAVNRSEQVETYINEPGNGGEIHVLMQRKINMDLSAVMSYRKTFAENNNISGLLGAEYRNNYHDLLMSGGTGLPGPMFGVISTMSNIRDGAGENESFRKMGFFANVRYNYDQRYYLAVTGRYDGSSRFGTKDPWGFFPSVSGGWLISEEGFFNVDFINSLKLRASWGVSGNSQIGLYGSRGLYSTGRNYGGQVGLFPDQLANPLLTWEKATQVNLGLDFSMFDDRLSGTFNVYQTKNSSLLLNVPLPATAGYGSILKNAGKVRNRGVEFSFNSINLKAGNFAWSSRFNISYAKNKIMSLSKGVGVLFPGNKLPLKVGYSMSQIKFVRFAGVNPADGRPMFYDAGKNISYRYNFNNQAVMGPSASPEVVGGFGNTFSYKGLSFNFFFQYQLGGHNVPLMAWNALVVFTSESVDNGRTILLTESWKNPGDITEIPKPWVGAVYPGSDEWDDSSHNFFSTDYIRLKNVSLQYSLPGSITDALNLSQLSVYVSAYNLLTFTNYPGFDPEVTGPFTQASYPPGRRISAGIDITF